jgi:CRP/FNR family transcriptional regulator, cyclic AMP receptor protein
VILITFRRAIQLHCGKEGGGQVANNNVNGFRIVPRGNAHTPREARPPAPYGLEIVENCVACPHLQERMFCNLPPAALQHLAEIASVSSYPKGAVLFVEGQKARGVFILCEGRVKLSTSSMDGKTLIARIADAGEILGLPAAVTGTPYELTAEVIEPAQVNFISRSDFLGLLQAHGEAAFHVAQQMGQMYHSAIADLRSVGLARSAGAKLARFLLDWCMRNGNGEGELQRVNLTLTHEEIAQTIGASRETVTRLFSEFKRKQLIQVRGSVLVMQDRAGLEELAGN